MIMKDIIATTFNIEVGNLIDKPNEYQEFVLSLYELIDNYKDILTATRIDHYNDGDSSTKIN